MPTITKNLLLLLRLLSLIFTTFALSSSSRERRQESLHHGNHPLLSLNLNLDALARANAASRAEELYQRIIALHQEGYYAVAPDIVSFNSVLKAWKNDPEKAIEFWSRQQNVQPNVRSYNTILFALARAGLYRQVEQVLSQLKESFLLPDRITYNTVLLAYAEAGLLRQAQDTLQEMVQCEYLAPDLISLNTLLLAYTNAGQSDAARHLVQHRMRQEFNVTPDVYTYTILLQDQNASAAMSLLDDMTRQQIPPNQVTYTTILRKLCAEGKLEQAHEIFSDMKSTTPLSHNARPDCVTYSVLMDGWSNVASRRPHEAVDRVTRLWEELRRAQILPDARTYTSLLTTYARSGIACEQALRVLSEIPSPSLIHYNAVLNAIAKCRRLSAAEKCQRARVVWESMSPDCDIVSYNSMLACCVGCADAWTVYEELLEQVTPTSLTFHYALKACANRASIIQDCTRFGCWNDRLLLQLSRAERDEWLSGATSVVHLPLEYSQHALPVR